MWRTQGICLAVYMLYLLTFLRLVTLSHAERT